MNVDTGTHIRLLELGVLDARELQQLLPEGSYRVEKEQLYPGVHGDLGITEALVIVVAPVVIQAISAWMLKKRKRQSVVLSVEKIAPGGVIEKYSLDIKLSESEAPQADVLKQLVNGLKLDPALITAVSGEGK